MNAHIKTPMCNCAFRKGAIAHHNTDQSYTDVPHGSTRHPWLDVAPLHVEGDFLFLSMQKMLASNCLVMI